MRLLIFSDSHGATKDMASVVSKHGQTAEQTRVIFLGDYVKDCNALNFDGQIHIVAGNCDFNSRYPNEQLLEIGGVKIWMTHGHLFNVKSSLAGIERAAAAQGAEICLFGHTHEPMTFYNNGTLFLNPGSISQPRGLYRKSYAVIELAENQISPQIVEL